MRHLRRLLLVGLVVMLTLMPSGCGSPLRFPLTAGASFEFSAYYENDIAGAAKLVLNAEHDLVRTVYPVWYQVDPAGAVADVGVDAAVQQIAVDTAMAVVPVVRSQYAAGQDPAALLRSSAATARAVTALTEIVKAQNYDGLNIDFSNLPANAGASLQAFVRDLGRRLHNVRKKLVVTVPATPQRPAADTAAYDYRQLSRVADFIIVAAYDLHSDQTGAGAVAPLGWVQESIAAALQTVPANRIILAVGAYGYGWPSGPGLVTYLSAADAYQLAAQQGAAVTFDATQHEATFSYPGSSGTRTVWFEDQRSVSERVALARARGLYGVVYWRIGQEEPGFWSTVSAAMHSR